MANADDYKVQWRSGSQTYDAAARQQTTSRTSHTLLGLAAGTEYTVRVIATRRNASDSAPSTEATGTTPLYWPPSQPFGVTVVPAAGSLVVSWGGVYNADGYKVQWKSGSQAYNTTDRQATVSADTRRHTITGLAAGTEYTVRVITTRTGAPDSRPSSEATGTPPAPGVPGRVTVTSAARSLVVSWDAAAGANGYKVQWRSGSQAYDSARQATATGTSHTITGLTPGTTYTVRVVATRANPPDSAPSAEATGVPHLHPAPGVPGGVTATPAVEGLVVSWTAPANAYVYFVQWKSGSQSYSLSTRFAWTSATGPSHTILGLTAGTQYTVRVAASRSGAPRSAPSSEATGTPLAGGVPGSVTATPAAGSLVVSWTAAANANGYKVQWKSGAQAYDTSGRQAAATGTSHTIAGLAAGTEYTVRVVATRANVPDSAPSPEATGTPLAGGVPGNVVATPAGGSLVVSWTAVAGASGYKVQWKSGAQAYDAAARQAAASGTSHTITGLAAGTAYTVRVVATHGSAPDSAPSAEATGTPSLHPAPGVPGSVTATPAAESLAVSWTAAADADGYKVQWRSYNDQAYDASTRQATVTGTSHTIPGLTPFTTYFVRVVAVRTNAPDGAPSPETANVPFFPSPGVPGSVAATPAAESLAVSWNTVPDADGYSVQWKSGAQAYNTSDRHAWVAAPATSHTIPGLTAGTEYTVRVTATRSHAAASPPSEATGTPTPFLHPAPGVPGSVTATPALNSLVVSWTAAANADGYKVQWRSWHPSYDSTRQATVTGTSHTIAGLAGGRVYTVRVVATRANAPDSASSEATGTPFLHPAPGVPGSVTVTPALNSLAVRWTAAADANGYKVQWKSGSQAYDAARQATAHFTSHTITGLTAGTTYTVRVVATRTNAPDGAASPEATGTPPAAPGVPGSVTATPALNSLAVSWTAAADADGYKVQWKSGSQTYDAAARQATVATGTSHTITGLAAGTAYTVRVVATRTNAPDGAASPEAAGTAQHPAPGVPGSVTATPTVQSLVVRWTAGANADGYQVQWRSGSQSYDAARQATATGTSHTITGLTAGTHYFVRVIAVRTNAPDGAASPEATGTPPAAVGVPGSVTVTPAEESLVVRWTAAVGAGGYKVQWKSGSQSYDAARQATTTGPGHTVTRHLSSSRQQTVTSGTSHTITGLTAGTQYTVRVIATHTNAPDGAPSPEATGTPLALGVPGNVTVTPAEDGGDAVLVVSWTAAAGADAYKVQWKSGSQSYDASTREGWITGTSYTITGLTAGTTYTVRVIATRTNAPDSAPSPEATGGIPRPLSPRVELTRVDILTPQSIYVLWSFSYRGPDAGNGSPPPIFGRPPHGKLVKWALRTNDGRPVLSGSEEISDRKSGSRWTETQSTYFPTYIRYEHRSGSRILLPRFEGAYEGRLKYTVTVSAIYGGRRFSDSASGLLPYLYNAPGVPGGVAATPAAGSLVVSWTAAADADGYKVQWKSGSQSYDANRQAAATGTSHTITGLTAGRAYTVRVVATRSQAPDGAPSSEAAGTPGFHPAPGVPGGVAAAPAVQSLVVSWTAAADADGYKVQWKSGSQAYNTSDRQATATGTSHTITGLAAGTAYTVRVIATRRNAPDGLTSLEAIGTPTAAAGVPGGVTATPALNSLAVRWTAAANADGYKVQWRSGAQAYDTSDRQATATGTSHTITGLAGGTAYTVRVVATRSNAPDGAPSPEAAGTPYLYPAPGVPGSVAAAPAVKSLEVSWGAAADADGYRVQWKSGSQAYDSTRQATASGTSHTITGLAVGTEYTVRVVATRTNAPDGSPSPEATGIPTLYPAPGVPGSVTATPALNSLAVSWAAAANADGYKVQWKSGSQSYDAARQATATGTSHTITGLAGGTAYTVRVVATRTNAPDSAASPEATGTPYLYPAAGVPGSVTATPAVGSLAVSWTAATDADGYKVQWKSGSQSYDAARQATTTGTSHTITGLTAGTEYTVRVVATRTNAPDGAASPEATGTAQYPAPGVPGSVTATPALNSLVVSWSAATNAGGYKVQWKSGAQSYDAARQATATGTSHTITGLAAGTEYTVRVIATRTNAPDGAASSEATGTAQYPAPDVPGSVTATPAVQSLVVSWAAATNATGYKVQWKSGAQAYDSATRQATAAGTSHTITGLTAGTAYTVRVVATRTNAPDSAASSEATGTPTSNLHPAPGVPGSVTATPALNSLAVSWGAAANADGYKVQWKSGAQAYDAARQATTTGTSHTITGLTAGTAYTVRVIATRTNAPDSAASSESTGTAQYPAPGVPGSVTATPALNSLAVSWTAAANADGYKVQWKSGSQTYDAAARQATVTTGTSHTITGLAAGTAYTVRVVATRTNAPDGAASPEATGTAQYPAAGVPGSVTATPALNSLAVSWAAAANADGYKVQWKSGSQSYDTSTRQATATGTSHTITGLAAGTEYTVRVIATRANAPDSAASSEATGTPPAAAGVPGSVTATPAVQSLVVSWSAATNADGYKVQWKSGSQSYDAAARQATASGTSHTITGLTAGTAYTVRVIATRANAPDSAASSEATGTAQYPAAGVPGSVTAAPALNSLVVSWSAATNANGYKVQWKSGSQSYDASTRQATATGTSHTITGLTAGTAYTVRVIATRTNAPDSAPSSEATGTPPAAAGVPGSVTATPAVNSLVVSWSAAANADGYKVQWKSGSQSYDTSARQATVASGTSHTITGLTAGTEYTVRVIATRTNAPDGAASSEATGTAQYPAADVPGSVTATPALNSLVVSWSAAANADGYKVQWKSGSQSYDASTRQATASGTSHTITGLTAGTAYTVRVIATRTNAPDSAASSEATGTAQHPAPGVPGSVTATPAVQSLVVSWSAAANADGYKVQWKSGAQAYSTSTRQATTTGTSHTITGLTAGTEYTVRVIATRTNAPDSAASSEATGTAQYPAAGVPGSVTATPAVQSLVVSWGAASNANGYKVQWKSGSQSYSTSTRQATATGTSYTITGLTAGTTYTVRVIATRTNAPDSAASSEATGTPQQAAAGVPGSVTATPAVQSLVVSWSAAANADGYKVQWKSGSQTYDSATRQATASGTSYTITGLTAGTEYTVRVIATRTNAPDSAASSEATGTAQHPAPGVPGSVTATPALNSLVVSWAAATNADGYKVQWKSGSQSYAAARQATASGTSHTITGLTAGTAYTVRVIATRTNAPDSAPSSEATGTPPAAAGVPGSVTATPAVNSLVVSWSAAANADGYKVQWKSGAQAYDATRQATATGTSHTITGLTAGTAYTVRVIATRTNAPDGAASSEATGTPQQAASGVPGSVTATPAVQSLVVSWATAANANGYKVQWKSGGQSYDTSTRQATTTGTSHTLTGLTAGTTYTVRVIATRTNAPDSAASSEATGTAQYPAPGVPGSVTATPALNSLAVSWSAAANASGYKVQWKSGSQSYDTSTRQATATGTSHTITGLTAGTEYTVRVIATRTNAPDSAASSEATGTAQYPAPGVPGSVTAAPALNSLVVSWAAATNASGYKVQWKSGAQAYNTSDRQATASGTSHTITGLTAGTAYTVRVIATRTNAPDSAPSSEATGTAQYPAAGVPGSVTAAPALNSLVVSWSAATNASGYKVQWKSGSQSYDTSTRQATVATGTSHTITGLTAGTAYTVRVIATRTNAPDSAPSSEATGTAQYPAAGVPGSVTAAPALNSLVISWGAATNADGYKVQWKSGSQSYDASTRQATATGTSHTITGLTAGTAYTVRVIATRTNAPDGAASSEATGTAQYPAAGVPGSVTAAPALNSLVVSWSAATNASGYKVQWKSGSQSYSTSTRQATATSTSHTITGLTAGTEYTVRVIATRTNAPDSAASSEATGTPPAAAGVPGSVTAAPAVQSLVVSWSAATNASGYKVQWKSGAQAYDAARQATATGTSHTITGLTAGTAYTVRVIATRTNAPDSAASSEATGTPQRSAPGVPGSVTATPAVGSLVVSWSAAANASGYKVQWKSGSQSYSTSTRQATATGTSYTITGLTAGTTYTVRVIATRTNAPDSAASSEATGTPQQAAAGVPGSVTATPAVNSLVVSWSAAANASGYKVQWKSGSQSYDSATRQATATGTSHTITGLTAGTAYTVRVIATRANAPDSAASSEATGTAQYPAAGVPGSVTATPALNSLAVSWTAAANADGYKVQWKSGSQTYNTSTRQATASGTSYTITGLTAGTTYTVRVIATRTNAPDSAASSEATGTAQYPAPGVPGSVTAAPALNSLVVSWGAAANADGYKVQWKSGSQSYDASTRQATATGTSHTITGLTAGTEYTVRVIATRTNAPDSAASSEATGTPPAAAGVPGSVTATPALNSLVVSWSAAANASGYKVQWKSGSQSYDAARQATATGTSHTITGLTAGTAYTVRVIATRTNAPDSAASSEATGTPQQPASGVPGSVTATPAVQSLVVSWSAAANASGYKVQWKSGSQSYDTSTRQATVATGTSHTITGLTAGTAYTVRVIATRTNAPDGAPSSEATGIAQYPAAGVPGSVTATPALRSLVVSWGAAANAGGYKVQWKSGAQAYDAARQATATGTSHTITGLTPGTAYTVRVIATRANAPDSAASSEATGTPPAAPGVPGSVTAAPAVQSLAVSWAAAANADGYKVQWKSGSQSYAAARQATASGTSYTITGLTAGTAYTVRVIATRTNAPDSAASSEATGTAQYPAPGVPGSVTATPGLSSLVISWAAASNANGYKVQWKSGSQSYSTSTRQATATGTSYTITGLTAGTTYTVRVIATRTNAPDSAASSEATGTPQQAAAGVPGSVTATPAVQSLVVSWSAATNASGYKVQWKSGAQAYDAARQATTTSTSHTITGLTAGTEYTVRVIATRTNAPDSAASSEATGTPQQPASGVPGSVTATPAVQSLVVSWSAAANASGYKVQWKSGSQSYNTSTRQATASGTSHTITGLTAGTTYTVRVIATRTNAPDSAASSEATGTPQQPASGVPGSVTATPAVQSLVVSWSAAANASGYKVQWKSGSQSYSTSTRQATATGTSHTITGLTAGTTYTVRVIATRTNAPDSAASSEATGTAQYPAAGVPGSVTATPALNSLVISWSAATNAGGYKVQWKSGAQAYNTSDRQATASGTSHTITGLTAGTTYTVRVIATRTNAPDSAPSSEATGTPPAAAGVPGSVTATPAVQSLVVSWSAAANAGGYKVQWKSGSQSYDTSTRQATTAGTSHTITGLTAGTAYTVRVIATRTNAPDSAASSEATGTPQQAASGVPGSVTATPALNSLVVSWAAATNADGYKVQWKSGSQSYDAATRQATATGTSHTITGLTAGTEYTVRVIATRANAPDSAASSEATGTPQQAAAGVPGSVTATPGLNSLVISWAAAANANGYKVQWKSGAQAYNTSDRQATASGTNHTITGLTAGTTYTVRVIATRTNAPDSAPSSEATGTPPAAAGVPGSVTATPAVQSLVVSWAAAANASGYKVQWKSGSQSYAAARQATASGTSYTITGLTAGTAYTVRVIATRTNAPDSAASSEATGTAQYPAPGVPGSVTATPGLSSLVISWAAASNANGYKVQWKSGSQSYSTSTRQATATGTSHTITGLTAGTTYTVRVIATRTNAPDSAASSEATGTPQQAAAGVPGSVTATPAVQSLVVSWSAATNASGYKVQWKSGSQSYDTSTRQATATGTSHTITGLTAGTDLHGSGHRHPHERPRQRALLGGDRDATAAGIGRAGQRDGDAGREQPRGVLVRRGERERLQGAVEVRGAGVRLRYPPSDGDRHEPHHHRPDGGDGLYGAGDRHPHERSRQRRLLGGDRDATAAAGGRAGQRDGDAGGGEPRGVLGRCNQRDRLQGAVEVRKPVVQHFHAASDGDRHEPHDHRPDRGHGLHGAGHRHPDERPGQRALLGGDRDATGGGGGAGQRDGDPGREQPRGVLVRCGQRERLQGAVEVREPGVQHFHPAGDGQRHEPHHHRPDRGHDLYGAGHRHPDERSRQRALLGGDRDTPTAGGGCAGRGDGDAGGVDQSHRFLDRGGQRERLHGAVEVREPVVQRFHPAGDGDDRHELHHHRPDHGHGIHRAGHRHPHERPRRQRGLPGRDRDAGAAAAGAGDGDAGGGGPPHRFLERDGRRGRLQGAVAVRGAGVRPRAGGGGGRRHEELHHHRPDRGHAIHGAGLLHPHGPPRQRGLLGSDRESPGGGRAGRTAEGGQRGHRAGAGAGDDREHAGGGERAHRAGALRGRGRGRAQRTGLGGDGRDVRRHPPGERGGHRGGVMVVEGGSRRPELRARALGVRGRRRRGGHGERGRRDGVGCGRLPQPRRGGGRRGLGRPRVRGARGDGRAHRVRGAGAGGTCAVVERGAFRLHGHVGPGPRGEGGGGVREPDAERPSLRRVVVVSGGARVGVAGLRPGRGHVHRRRGGPAGEWQQVAQRVGGRERAGALGGGEGGDARCGGGGPEG